MNQQIEIENLAHFGDVKYINKLLSIVQYESLNIENSLLLQTTLGALWCLSGKIIYS
jgi:hypothetical protein